VIHGEGTALIEGVTPQEVFDFVLDPVQYTKADTKVDWITKLADLPDGMLAREDGRFLGVLPGSVVTRYWWNEPYRIDITLEHGMIAGLHAWFDIQAEGNRGTRVTHVEEIEFGWGPLGWIHDRLLAWWWQHSVAGEVDEIARLLRAGNRGNGPHG